MIKYFFILLFSILLSVLMLLNSNFKNNRISTIIFCNVGQGSATLIVSGGLQVLVDTGKSSDLILECLEKYMPFADKKIDVVILSHPDADHVAAITSILDYYAVDVMYWSDLGKENSLILQVNNAIENMQSIVDVGTGYRGVYLQHDALSVSFISPTLSEIGEDKHSYDYNNLSAVLDVMIGDYHVLLPGDAEMEVLIPLMHNGLLQDYYSLILAPHHGSKNSFNSEFFSLVQVDFVVFSVGESNNYGHPDDSVITLLTNLGISYARTDVDGDVSFVVRGSLLERVE